MEDLLYGKNNVVLDEHLVEQCLRKTGDCMIASVAIEHDIALLHNDKDFDAIRKVCGLKVVRMS